MPSVEDDTVSVTKALVMVNLGHLEGDRATVADDLAPILTSLSRKGVIDKCLQSSAPAKIRIQTHPPERVNDFDTPGFVI